MALQNRVSVTGEIISHPTRGPFTGNRGIIHDPKTRTLLSRRWTTKAWIVCALAYKDHHRTVMSPGTWTELFFMDEVTALAAGHRPCFYCRRAIATRFAGLAASAAAVAKPRAPLIDKVLHSQRLAAGARPEPVAGDELDCLPDGVVIATDRCAYAVRGDSLLPWTPSGYGPPASRQSIRDLPCHYLTPALTRAALAAGFEPRWHPSVATGR